MTSSIQLLRSSNAQERPFPGNLLDGQPAINTNPQEPGLFFKANDGTIIKIGPAAITSDGAPPNSGAVGQTGNTIGELWLDKSLSVPVLRVYDGFQWIDAGSGGGGGGGAGTFVRWIYTAVGGETTLSGTSGGVTLAYSPSLEEVFVNGVLITRGSDYVATNGTSITGLAPLSPGDVVTVTSIIPLSTIVTPGQVSLLRWTVNATAGQTLLSGTDLNGSTLAYTAGLEEVYVNGVFFRRGLDYTATNGTSITLTAALTLVDEVTVLAWSPFTVANQITNQEVASNAGIESSKLAFTQSGAGAVSRTVLSKLTDVVSIKDFGAVGDGVTNDRLAFIAAMNAASGKTLFIPSGTYLIAIPDGGGLGGIPEGTTIQGEGDRSFLDIRTTTTTYLNVFGVRSNVSFKDLKMKLTVQSTQLASLFVFSGPIARNIKFVNCDIFSSTGVSTPSHFTFLFNTPSALSSEVSDVLIDRCSIHNWHFTVLKTNPSQSTERRWVITGNRFYDNQTAHWSPNSPSGVWDDMIISNNLFGSIYDNSPGSVHHIGLASCTNCVISNNTFKGLTAGEAIHIEEASENIAISGNVIEVGELTDQTTWGDGIRILDNDIGGLPRKAPAYFSITGNTLKRSGSIGGVGIAFQYDPEAPNARNMTCTGNTIEGFRQGIEVDAEADSLRISNNLIVGCSSAIFIPGSGSPHIQDNTMISCGKGYDGAGLVGKSHFINCVTPFGPFPSSLLTTTAWSTEKRNIALNAANNTTIVLLQVGARIRGNFVFSIGSGVSTVSGSIALTYDGTTLTTTTNSSFAIGSLAYTSMTVSGGNLNLTIFNAGATLTGQVLRADFDGTHIFN